MVNAGPPEQPSALDWTNQLINKVTIPIKEASRSSTENGWKGLWLLDARKQLLKAAGRQPGEELQAPPWGAHSGSTVSKGIHHLARIFQSLLQTNAKTNHSTSKGATPETGHYHNLRKASILRVSNLYWSHFIKVTFPIFQVRFLLQCLCP